jgi:hypothetical protein
LAGGVLGRWPLQSVESHERDDGVLLDAAVPDHGDRVHGGDDAAVPLERRDVWGGDEGIGEYGDGDRLCAAAANFNPLDAGVTPIQIIIDPNSPNTP